MIEVELRGKISLETFNTLRKVLAKYPTERDDKKTVFYDFTNGILKISENCVDGATILSLKLGNEIEQNLNEFEVRFQNYSMQHLRAILSNLGYKERTTVDQLRTNYKLEDGIALSLKFTEDWGYHFEIEELVKSRQQVPQAKIKLNQKCKALGIIPMSESELRTFLASIT
jgi:adenylate cyclase class IV